MPRVSLDTKDPIVSDRRVACTVGIVHPKGGGTGLTNPAPAIVRLHGASSQAFPKKSFSFSLEDSAALLAMGENSRTTRPSMYGRRDSLSPAAVP